MVNKGLICKKYLCTVGKSALVVKQDGSEEQIFAVIQQTWRKNKSRFEDIQTKLGIYYNAYYMYLGPYDCDIMQLGEKDYILCDNQKFMFVKKERVMLGGNIQFYAGVLKGIEEADADVFNK